MEKPLLQVNKNILMYILLSITETSTFTLKKLIMEKPLLQVESTMAKTSVTIKYFHSNCQIWKIMNMENLILQVYYTRSKISVSIKSEDFVIIIPNLIG